MFDIGGQHEGFKVTFKVIRVSKTTLGAERSTCMTHFGPISTISEIHNI